VAAADLWRQRRQPERDRAARKQPQQAGKGGVCAAGEVELGWVVATAAAVSERHRLVGRGQQRERGRGRVGDEMGRAMVSPWGLSS
jgi:hypothetical protein